MRFFRAALLACAATLAIGSAAAAAAAADMPVKTPVYKAVPFWSWSGFYAGVNAGYGIGKQSVSSSSLVTALGTGPFSQASSGDIALSGALFGLQIGYNVQMQNWLAGMEADYQFGRQSGGSTASHTEAVLGPAVPSAASDSVTASIKSFGTLRGRLGAITDGNTLWYGTGGLAWGRRELTVASAFSALGPPIVTQTGAASTSFSDSRFGWVLGGGVESRLAGNWTAKIEYLYLNLGSMDVVTTGPVTGGGAVTGAVTTTAGSSFREHIVRAGLNYKLADGSTDMASSAYAAAGPVKPVPFWSWSGFYAGVNAGYGVGRESLNSSPFVTALGTGPFSQTRSDDLAVSGALFGIQLGYNIQMQNWLTGIEADYQFGRQRGGSAASHTEAVLGPAVPSAMSDSATASIKSFGTLRGRLGWITGGNTLLYGTGGLAWGRRELTVATAFSALGPPIVTQTGATAGSFSDSRFGWVLGGGVESRLTGNWSAKLEYLYLNLGTISVVAAGDVTGGGAVTGAVTTTASSSFREHVARAGLNYKFN